MTTLDNVLLGIGPNDREYVDDLLDTVEAVAKPASATVYLLHVFPDDEYETLMEQLQSEVTQGEIQPDELAARHDGVRTPASRLEDHGIEYAVRGRVGDPSTEVVRMAAELDTDLLFIGGSSRSPAGKAVFGNEAQRILLNAPCPVTYVRRDR